jgi:ABC-2 type transport system permease protein/capsular polysaccharide transport system permease protein
MQGEASLIRSWVIQRRVIVALLMREILTRYGRHNIGFLWLFFEPMIFTLGVTALWMATKSVHGSDLPIVAFALTGYSSVLLWRNMPGRCICALGPNLSLMYHRNVKIIDIYLARLMLEAAGASMSFATLSLLFIAIGWMQPPEDVMLVLGGWIMLAWLGGSLALLLGALSEKTEIIEKLWHPFSYLLFPLSGAAFMVSVLPLEMQKVVLWIPMVHGTEMVRAGFFGARAQAHYDVLYMAMVSLVLTLVALFLIGRVANEVSPE